MPVKNEIIIAENFAKSFTTNKSEETPSEYISAMLIAFAKLHVQAAIKAIVNDNSGNMNEADIPYLQKAYPLENIK